MGRKTAFCIKKKSLEKGWKGREQIEIRKNVQ